MVHKKFDLKKKHLNMQANFTIYLASIGPFWLTSFKTLSASVDEAPITRWAAWKLKSIAKLIENCTNQQQENK